MTILIADQNQRFRSAVRKLLEVDGKLGMVWEADDGEKTIQLARDLRPDLVMMDISLPRVNGLEATRMINKLDANVQVIIMGQNSAAVYRRAAIRNGADAFIPKSTAWLGNASVSVNRRRRSLMNFR